MSHQTEPALGGRAVLVTGGTGYLATWIIIELLQRGYHVRATVRNLRRSDEVRQAVVGHTDGVNLSFTQANLLDDAGWIAAMQGVDYVLHVASPLPLGEFRKQDLVRPAREGMVRVLSAASQTGVKRTVVTSSIEAVKPARDDVIVDEQLWADPPDTPAYNYARSKVLAERDAWKWVKDSNADMDLVTVLPSAILGPALGTTYARSSLEVIRLMLAGKMPAVPNMGWNIADVRDLADLHIRAMTAPDASGHRFLAAGEFLWFHEIAELLRANLGKQAAKVSTRRLPDAIVRVGARFSPEMAQIRTNLNRQIRIDTTAATTILDWHPRPAEQPILDAARSLIENHIVNT